MSKTVWKYDIKTTNTLNINMPKGAEILDIQEQKEKPKIWALVNPDNSLETRKFKIYGTGHNIDSSINKDNYIGTYQLHRGNLIFHVFETAKEQK